MRDYEGSDSDDGSRSTRLRPYECKICGKKWEVRSKLEIHLRTHSGSKPFGCDICSRSFNVLSNLRRHVKTVHTVVKPFNCRFCRKTFNQNSNLKRHEKTHSSNFSEPSEASYTPSTATAALFLAAQAESVRQDKVVSGETRIKKSRNPDTLRLSDLAEASVSEGKSSSHEGSAFSPISLPNEISMTSEDKHLHRLSSKTTEGVSHDPGSLVFSSIEEGSENPSIGLQWLKEPSSLFPSAMF